MSHRNGMFHGWPDAASPFILQDDKTKAMALAYARAECNRGQHDGPWHHVVETHNAACDVMTELAVVRALYLATRGAGSSGGKP